MQVVAHLAAAAAEVTRHLEPYLRGDAVPPTKSFEIRGAPYRAMGDEALRRRLEVEEEKMRLVIGEVLAKDPRAVIPWTGRQMAVAKFIPHLRNEFALHRWDIAGDDETSTVLLSQPELVEHAVGVLGEILLRRGAARDPDPGKELHVRLRSPSARDVRVSVRADWRDSSSWTTTPSNSMPLPARCSSGGAARTTAAECAATSHRPCSPASKRSWQGIERSRRSLDLVLRVLDRYRRHYNERRSRRGLAMHAPCPHGNTMSSTRRGSHASAGTKFSAGLSTSITPHEAARAGFRLLRGRAGPLPTSQRAADW